MIAQTTIEVTSRTDAFPSLVLAPFSAEDMAAVIPADPATMKYLPGDVAIVHAFRPEILFGFQEKTPATVWGIFEQTVEPPNFVGRVSLHPFEAPSDAGQAYAHQCRVTQEVGTILLCTSRMGKGIGSLAKLAVTSFALNHAQETETHAFLAMTSEHNNAAQRSLEKVGFEQTLSRYERNFPNGAATQTWALADPEARASFAGYDTQLFFPSEIARMAAGWQRYRAAMQDIRMNVTGS